MTVFGRAWILSKISNFSMTCMPEEAHRGKSGKQTARAHLMHAEWPLRLRMDIGYGSAVLPQPSEAFDSHSMVRCVGLVD
jgi:hypothetical protein